MNGTGDVQLLAAGHLFWEQPYGAGGGGAQGSVFFLGFWAVTKHGMKQAKICKHVVEKHPTLEVEPPKKETKNHGFRSHKFKTGTWNMGSYRRLDMVLVGFHLNFRGCLFLPQNSGVQVWGWLSFTLQFQSRQPRLMTRGYQPTIQFQLISIYHHKSTWKVS